MRDSNITIQMHCMQKVTYQCVAFHLLPEVYRTFFANTL